MAGHPASWLFRTPPLPQLCSLSDQAPAQDRVGESVVRIQFQRLADLRDRLVVTARPVKKKVEVRIKKVFSGSSSSAFFSAAIASSNRPIPRKSKHIDHKSTPASDSVPARDRVPSRRRRDRARRESCPIDICASARFGSSASAFSANSFSFALRFPPRHSLASHVQRVGVSQSAIG